MTFQSRCREFMALAAELRRAGFRGHVTAGGHFATLACRELLRDAPAIDSIVRHEGEEGLPLPLRGARRRTGVSRDVGRSSVKHLRAIHAFASAVDLSDDVGVRDYTVAVARAVHRDDFALLGPLRRVRGALEARTHRPGAGPLASARTPIPAPPPRRNLPIAIEERR